MADDGALDGRDANVKESMLAVGSEALEFVFWRIGRGVNALGGREEDAEDGLEEG